MPGAYSQDLRDRVIDAVAREGMSRRAAAARFGVSESSAIKWVQRFEQKGLNSGDAVRAQMGQRPLGAAAGPELSFAASSMATSPP